VAVLLPSPTAVHAIFDLGVFISYLMMPYFDMTVVQQIDDTLISFRALIRLC
jgi:hypothetical protein